jgi:SAM-dependent methyltransferase
MDRFRNAAQPDWDWWGRLWPTPGETLRRLGVTPGLSVVEVGSGNGYFALPAARIVDPATVYAVDLDADLLADLRELTAQQAIGNVEPIEGDVRALSDLLPERVDVALLANCFHGIEDPTSVLQEVVATVRPGGRLLVVNWHDLPRSETTVAGAERGPPEALRLSPPATQELVEDAVECSLERTVDLPPYHYALEFLVG